MKYKRQIIFGICYALFAWILFIIADIVDEFILDSRQVPMVKINAIVTPFVMLICHSINVKKNKPSKKELSAWFVSYDLMYLVLWYIIFYLQNTDKFIPQRHRDGVIDLNGIEYTYYGISTLFFFNLLCLLFHFVYNVIKKNKK